MLGVKHYWIISILIIFSVEVSGQIAFRFERTSVFNKRIISSGRLGLLTYNLNGIKPVPNDENALAILPPIMVDAFISATPVRIIDRPLNYPNPFRRQGDTTLYYRLSRHTDVEIKIYNMLGHQLASTKLYAGSEGGWEGINRVKLSRMGIPVNDLPSGVYFYLIIGNGQILGKGKMAAI